MTSPAGSPPPIRPADPRPRSVKVLGVLNLLFGASGLLCTPAVVGALEFIARQNADDPTWHRILTDRPYRIFLGVSSTISLALSASLLVAGIGLLRGRAWGRRLSLFLAVAGLIIPPVEIVLDYVLLSHQALVAGRAKGGDALGEEIVTELIYVAWELLGMAYPAILLYFLTRPRVSRALGRTA